MIENRGGQAGSVLANQFFLTATLVTYASLRQGGFRITPFTVTKVPQYAGMFFAGFVAHQFALNCTTGSLGDRATFDYMLNNKGGIMAGTTRWDPE